MYRRGFTLIEVLVVVAILGLLTAMLMPSLNKARQAARRAVCLTNIHNLETAHWLYMTTNNGFLIRVGLSHGVVSDKPGVAWINTLQKSYKNRLTLRSPADNSPHWPTSEGGEGVVIRPGALVAAQLHIAVAHTQAIYAKRLEVLNSLQDRRPPGGPDCGDMQFPEGAFKRPGGPLDQRM